jgi:putative hemolysin
MSGPTLEILLIVLLILANGIFAMSEIAIVTARKSRLKDWADKGNTRASVALDLANEPNQFLSTVQIGITLIGILAGAFAGRTVADWLSAILSGFPRIEPYSRALALGLVVIVTTYLSVIIGELVPKRLALSHPEGIATAMAIPMRLLARLSSPVVRLLSFSTDAMFALLGKRAVAEPPVTEEEIRTLVHQGTQAGVFEESEQDMVEAVFRLGDKTSRLLMTPRTQIIWLNIGDPQQRLRDKIIESGHSRFPVGDGSLDNVIGIVQAKDLLAVAMTGGPIDLHASLREPLFVPRSMSAFSVLDLFKQSGKHIALVMDEYGGIEGLLTHHDVLEAIAGEIPYSEKETERKAVQRQDGSWLLDGMLSVDEFKEIFQLDSLPGEKRDAYQTLGGFLFTQMGRVPSTADQFEWNNLRFEIVDMDGKRIDKVLVAATEKQGETGMNARK